METLIKNIRHAQGYKLDEIVEYDPGKIASLTLAGTKGAGITLFAFDEGEQLSTHAAPGDAMAVCLDGEGLIKIDGTPHSVHKGEMIVMPKNVPHSVHAVTRFKMLLVVIK